MTSSSPHRFDWLLAGVLSFRVPLLALAVGISISSCIAAAYTTSETLQGWCTEVFGAATIFIALIAVEPRRMSAAHILGSLFFASGIGVASLSIAVPRSVSGLLVELSASILLFLFFELLLRQALAKAASNEARLALRIQELRTAVSNRVMDTVRDRFPTVDEDALSEELDKMMFGDEWRPGIPKFEQDDAEWIALWQKPV